MAAGQFRNLSIATPRPFIAGAERDQLVNRGFAAMIGAAFGGNGLDDAVSYRIAELQLPSSFPLHNSVLPAKC